MGEIGEKRWNFGANKVVERSTSLGIRVYLNTLTSNLDEGDTRPVIALGHGDPSPFPRFSTDPSAVEAICDAVRSTKFNNYSAASGIPVARKWFVPGWRLGWMVTLDPHSIMKDSGFTQSLINVINISTDPATFIQGAIPDIIVNTKEEFFSTKLEMVRECAEICYQEIMKIPCITCPCKPEGSMFTMVKLNISLLEDISDDMDFCCKLAKEESIIILPGRAVGLKNWLRITFAVELDLLVEAFSRLKNFAQRHSKKQP